MLTLMAIGPALRTGVALEDRVSPKVLRAAPVARTRVFSVDEKQLVVHEARLADGGRYGGRRLSPGSSLPATTAEELSVQLSGMRGEEVFDKNDPASVARRC